MQRTNEIVSKNLVKFRTASGLTQAELANKISYSDKSISKWERGESLPDLNILIKLSQIYKVKLDDFLCEDEKAPKVGLLSKFNKHKKLYISLLSGGLTWFIATAVFMILNMISATQHIAWMSFVYAIPVCAIVLLTFSVIWGNEITNGIFSSIILWGTILSVCLSVGWPKIWLLCVSAGAFQILIIGWFGYKWFVKRKKKLNI